MSKHLLTTAAPRGAKVITINGRAFTLDAAHQSFSAASFDQQEAAARTLVARTVRVEEFA